MTARPVMRLLPATDQQALDQIPIHVWLLPDATPWCEIHHEDGVYLMRFPRLADFKLDTTGEVECHPVPGIDESTLRHLHFNQVVPAALSLQHRPVFHASAVVMGGTAIAFLGESGRGKSTLATYLGREGYPLLTDDGLELRWTDDGYSAVPSHSGVRLWSDSQYALLPPDATAEPRLSYTRKNRFFGDGLIPFAHQSAPMRRAYFLGEGIVETLTITAIPPREAHIAWVKHSFLLDVRNKTLMRAQFEQVAKLAALGFSYVLDYPRRYDALPSVEEALRFHLQQGV